MCAFVVFLAEVKLPGPRGIPEKEGSRYEISLNNDVSALVVNQEGIVIANVVLPVFVPIPH